MKFLRYIVVQLKIAGKKCPAVFALSLVFLAGTLLLAFSIATASKTDEKQNKVSFALVGNTEDEYLGVGIKLLTELDYSRYTIEFVEADKKEAEELLRKGTIKAYVEIPEDFISSMEQGELKKLLLVMRDETDGYGITLAREFMDMISDYVVASLDAIYSTFEVAGPYKSYGELMSATDSLMLSEANLAIHRNNLFDVKYVGVAYSLSYTGYYFCSLLLIFMMLCGIAAYPFFADRSIRKLRSLNGAGIKSYMQIVSEFFAYALGQLVFAELILLLIFLVMTGKGITISGIDITDMQDAFLAMKEFVPVSIAISAWQFMIYEFIGSGRSAVSTQFFVLIFVAYFSGLFYPAAFYPAAIRVVAEKSIFGTLMRYLSNIFLVKDNVTELYVILATVLLFLAVSTFVRRKRIGR